MFQDGVEQFESLNPIWLSMQLIKLCYIHMPNATRGDPQQCPSTMSLNNVPQQCPSTMSLNNVPQQCPSTMSLNNVPQQCPSTMSLNNVGSSP